MFVRRHLFIKSTVCVALYFLVCVIFIKVRKNFNSKQVTEVRTTEYQTVTLDSSSVSKINKRNVGSVIEMLRLDELKGETIDMQGSAALLRQVSNTCAKYNLKRTPFVKRHFLYNAKHKSLYCWIRKIASTSFTKLFSDMSDRRVSHNFYREVDFLSPKTLANLQHYVNDSTVFKLLVVRHPFQRLVSSYRDRIEDNSRYTAQSWLHVPSILYLSRPEFFRSRSSNDNIPDKIFLPDKRLKVIPSFREFVQWLLRQPSERDDVHWAPYHTHCAVCRVNYNFIMKLDDYTLGQINYVLSKLKLDRDKVYLPTLQRTRNGLTDFKTECKYFRNLTDDMVIRLYERYKVDFDMYGYKPDKYLRCAQRKD
ncbi:PREDICTED: carbohydrate sulfotransferase 11-like [Dinoponera quadriceps]|uniref:Carbohydrate sulfotransferase n=1 Tax=Dinoponera quadriceps TaxID=609295 RepID=A0A6P3X7D7_DINQU|nr:PREDICTED: carbohydrate sulfotransferase 11-like [Dinoponera quadriceps]